MDWYTESKWWNCPKIALLEWKSCALFVSLCVYSISEWLCAFFSRFHAHFCGAIERMLFGKTRLVYLIHLLFSMLDCFACFLSLNISKLTLYLADFILYLWCLMFVSVFFLWNAFCLHVSLYHISDRDQQLFTLHRWKTSHDRYYMMEFGCFFYHRYIV